HITALVQSDSGCFQADSGSIRNSADGREDVRARQHVCAARGSDCDAHFPSRAALHAIDARGYENVDSFLGKKPVHGRRYIGILARGDAVTVLDDGHPAAKAPEGLRQLEADIAAPEHDEVLGQTVELQRFYVRHRLRGLEARYFGNRGAGSDVDEDLVGGQHALAAVTERDLEGFRRREAPGAHDQFRAAGFVSLQSKRYHTLDHLALAPPDCGHVRRDRPGDRAEVAAAAGQVSHLGAPYLVLGREAVDVRTGTADPTPLYDGRTVPEPGEVPGQEAAAVAAAKDQIFVSLGLGHGC